jgi:hypothetical protein
LRSVLLARYHGGRMRQWSLQDMRPFFQCNLEPFGSFALFL